MSSGTEKIPADTAGEGTATPTPPAPEAKGGPAAAARQPLAPRVPVAPGWAGGGRARPHGCLRLWLLLGACFRVVPRSVLFSAREAIPPAGSFAPPIHDPPGGAPHPAQCPAP